MKNPIDYSTPTPRLGKVFYDTLLHENESSFYQDKLTDIKSGHIVSLLIFKQLKFKIMTKTIIKMRNSILSIIFFLTLGCASQKYPVKMEPTLFATNLYAMVGKTENDLRYSFGPPNEIIDNGEIGKVFVYKRPDVVKSESQGSTMFVDRNYVLYEKSPVYSTTVEYYVRFWLNSSGTITRWDSSGFEIKHDANAEKRHKAQINDALIWSPIVGIGFLVILLLAG